MTITEKKKKILFISHDSGTYGAQMSLYWILKSLDRSKYEAIVTIHKDGPLVDLVESLGWRVVKLQRIRLAKHERPPLKGLGERLTWWLWKKTRGEKVVQLVREEDIDLIYTNSMVCFEGAYAARKTKRPHIWHIREILPGNRKLFGVFGTRKTLKMVARHSDKVVCVSDAVKRQFTGWQRNPDKYITVYNGVNPDVFHPDTVTVPSPSIREKLGLPADVLLLAYVARISPQKGFSDLVDACALLRQDGADFHLLVAGDPIDQRYFKHMGHMITQSKLTERIHFLGRLEPDDMPALYKQVDIFVTSSHHEPFARSILEAMAMEVPVVGTNTGGTPEAVLSNKTGIIAKTGVPGSLAQGLQKLIADPQLRRQMGQAGRERILHHFTTQHYVDNLHALYQQLLG